MVQTSVQLPQLEYAWHFSCPVEGRRFDRGEYPTLAETTISAHPRSMGGGPGRPQSILPL
jgi:hypothetical protein